MTIHLLFITYNGLVYTQLALGSVLANPIKYLVEHPELWPQMGRAGRAHVEANYDINKLNDQLVKVYRYSINARFYNYETGLTYERLSTENVSWKMDE